MTKVFDIRMEHFIGDLGHIDRTVPIHRTPRRLFKITDDLNYPCVEHPVLQGDFDDSDVGFFVGGTIFHLAYCSNAFDVKKKYLNHLKKSNMHTPEYLRDWYEAHLFGQYPRKVIRTLEIPEVILNEFGIEKDRIYFETHKNLEIRHFIMLKQWIEGKPSIIDWGCGVGLYGYVADYLGLEYKGIEKSEYAVNNSVLGLEQGDILTYKPSKKYDLALVLDVLEHLEEEDLEKALKNIKNSAKKFIFSIPFLGDPNLDLDPTHKIKKDKNWWLGKLSKYFTIKNVPEEWLFKEQLLIGETK